MPNRFDTIELPVRARVKSIIKVFFFAFLYEFIILLSYFLILHIGLQFDRLCKSPLLNVVGLITSFLLMLVSISISALIGAVTGEFDMLLELWNMLEEVFHTSVLGQPQVHVVIGLSVVLAFLVRLPVWKLKKWQELSKLNLILKFISMLVLFLAGSLAVRHKIVLLSYAEMLLLSTGLIAFSFAGFWRWTNWYE